MGESSEALKRKIEGASDLGSVVRTMKALSAANIGQYERSVIALNGYYRSVELGLWIYLQRFGGKLAINKPIQSKKQVVHAVVFGSDQGLVGQFNNQVATYAIETLADLQVDKKVWAVGERVYDQLIEAGVEVSGIFSVPSSINAITPLVGQILNKIEPESSTQLLPPLYLFHNKPAVGALYKAEYQYVSPFDEIWINSMSKIKWSSNNLPQIIGDKEQTFKSLISEYFFVSLFRACAESQASENASRMLAMQRAEKNIGTLLENLGKEYHLLRQNSIDEELFDVISGFEALKT